MATSFPTIETATAAVSTMPTLAQLSFTGRLPNDSGVDLWSPSEVSGDWDAQCRAGREYGQEAVDYIRSTGDAAALGGIVHMIAERGAFSGVEAVFSPPCRLRWLPNRGITRVLLARLLASYRRAGEKMF